MNAFTEDDEGERERSIDILVVTSIVMTDENAVLFVSCRLRKYSDADPMSIELMTVSEDYNPSFPAISIIVASLVRVVFDSI